MSGCSTGRRAFQARARGLLAEVDDLQSMFAGDRALRGRLRVDLPSEVARTTMVPVLPDFMATHPELELEGSSTDRQVDLVQEGTNLLPIAACVSSVMESVLGVMEITAKAGMMR